MRRDPPPAVIPIEEYLIPLLPIPAARIERQQKAYIHWKFRSRRFWGLAVPRNIFVEELVHTPIEEQGTEIVERKGIGHPDSIADGLAESVSRALCRMYLERYGRILHHNTDQAEGVGGQSAPKFGGGVVREAGDGILVGRAVSQVDGGG